MLNVFDEAPEKLNLEGVCFDMNSVSWVSDIEAFLAKHVHIGHPSEECDNPRLLDEQDTKMHADLFSHSEAVLAYLTGAFIEDVSLEDSDEDS